LSEPSTISNASHCMISLFGVPSSLILKILPAAKPRNMRIATTCEVYVSSVTSIPARIISHPKSIRALVPRISFKSCVSLLRVIPEFLR